MSDDIFDLDDYENIPEQKFEIKKEEIITNIIQTQNEEICSKTEDPSLLNNIIEIVKSNEQPSLLSSSMITETAKKKDKIFAIEDNISLTEYGKIQNLALKTSFTLDPFQKRGIIRVERHENVLVCAHTSSGKTLVAEYAIAKSAQNKKRIIYTSPIKALSNQKYRDFKERFQDVGIVTGDVSINPEGQCIIMTTEILQNLLYKNSEKLKYVDYVIFDEVHYINDKERGHVWEEILILLPQEIGIVMLSATIPNYLQFAQWIGSIKNTKIYIEITQKRVVPLEHKIYINAKNIFVIKTSDDKINEDNIFKAISKAKEENDRINLAKSKPGANKKEKKEREEKLFHQIKEYNKFLIKRQVDDYNDNLKDHNKITLTHLKIEELVNYISKSELTPVVMFTFSIKKIDEYAKMLSKNTYVTQPEAHRILRFFDKCIGKLNAEDKKIGQVQALRMLLPSGVGVHHAGLLPVLKEIVEILYSKGLIKILFATTSFSIGLNMPTRTVVFTDITKFNDSKKEILSSSEYLQMCGRAGRRGIDDKGNVFILMGDKKYQPNPTELTKMVRGEGTSVESKFRLSYKTIINFFYRNIKNIVEFFKESYIESSTFMSLPEVLKEIEMSKEKLSKMKPINCMNDIESISEYYDLKKQIGNVRNRLLDEQRMSELLKTKGRVVIYNSKKQLKDIYILVVKHYTDYNGEIWCLNCINDKKTIQDYENEPKTIGLSKGVFNGKLYTYFTIYPSDVVEICDYTLKSCSTINQYDQDASGFDFYKKKDIEMILSELLDINSKKTTDNDNIKVINYLKTSKNDLNIHMILKEKQAITSKLICNKCNECPLQNEHLIQYDEIKKVRDALERNEVKLKEENLRCFKEFQSRLNVLKKLQYVDEENQLLLQGKAAKEISSNDSLLVTEILLSNIINKLSVEELIAFLSAFVGNQNSVDYTDPDISAEFTKAIIDFKKINENINKIEKVENFQESDYNRKVSFSLAKAIKLWMQKKPFYEILSETDLEEGKVFSVINRLTLFLDSICELYEVLGNKTLGEKFVKAKEILLRDIMTCRSLYLEEDLDMTDL